MSDRAATAAPPPSAIPTVYSGHTFRSRLEARWALFFDQLGVPWLYEAEGFELPSGRYLPDFLLPRLDTFVELKPVAPTREEQIACRELADATKRRVVLFYGAPGFWLEAPEPDGWSLETDSGLVFWPGYQEDQQYLPCLCPVCDRVGIEFNGRGARVCKGTDRHTDEEVARAGDGHGDKSYSAADERIRAAARLANAHRFWNPGSATSRPSGDRTPATWRRPR